MRRSNLIILSCFLIYACEGENDRVQKKPNNGSAKSEQRYDNVTNGSIGDSIVTEQKVYQKKLKLFLKESNWKLFEVCKSMKTSECTNFSDSTIYIRFSDSLIKHVNGSCEYLLTLGTNRLILNNCNFLPYQEDQGSSIWYLSQGKNSFTLISSITQEDDEGSSVNYTYKFINSEYKERWE